MRRYTQHRLRCMLSQYIRIQQAVSKFQLTSRNFVMSDGREWYIFVLLVMSEICRSPLTLIGKTLLLYHRKVFEHLSLN